MKHKEVVWLVIFKQCIFFKLVGFKIIYTENDYQSQTDYKNKSGHFRKHWIYQTILYKFVFGSYPCIPSLTQTASQTTAWILYPETLEATQIIWWEDMKCIFLLRAYCLFKLIIILLKFSFCLLFNNCLCAPTFPKQSKRPVTVFCTAIHAIICSSWQQWCELQEALAQVRKTPTFLWKHDLGSGHNACRIIEP